MKKRLANITNKIFKKITKDKTHYKKAEYYSYREIIMRIIIYLCLACYLGFIVSAKIEWRKGLVNFAYGYLLFFALAFLVLYLFMKYRSFLILEYDINEFDDYLKNLLEKYNPLVADVFVYGLWNYIIKSDVKYEMFESGKYEDLVELKQRDYIIISFFRCVTYQLDGRTYRIPKYFKHKELFNIILTHYSKIMKNKKAKTEKRDDLFKSLTDYESSFEIEFERKTAKDKMDSMTSSGGIIESFTVLSNNDRQMHGIKKAIAATALITMLLHLGIASEEFNVYATFIFEFITVFFMFADVTKDKDYRYLH